MKQVINFCLPYLAAAIVLIHPFVKLILKIKKSWEKA